MLIFYPYFWKNQDFFAKIHIILTIYIKTKPVGVLKRSFRPPNSLEGEIIFYDMNETVPQFLAAELGGELCGKGAGMRKSLEWLLTGGLLPIGLLMAGVYFLILLRGKPLTSPRRMMEAMRRPTTHGVSPFRAVTMALAGTLGVGNIVGVANAIAVGGAGAVFWMWISALLAMILKYAEILLAVSHRRTRRDGGRYGGAIYYIRDCFEALGRHRTGMLLAAAFAVLMILNACSMGCVIQVNAVTSALEVAAGVPALLGGLLLLAITLPVILRGSKGISALTEYLVPIMSCGYLILSAAVLCLRWEALPSAFQRIFAEAFSPMGMAGGVLGFFTSKAIRVGTMRGLLSNEAGCGTAPTAHACADTESPAAQGVWGIFEVFVDTIVLCTLTALVILIAFPRLSDSGTSGVMITVAAYSSVLGKWAEYFLCAAIFCFGYATVICWAGYGMESIRAVTAKKRYAVLYVLLFCACIPLGSMAFPNFLWLISDFAIAALTTLNLVVLILLRREIQQETLKAFSSPKP